MWPAIARLILRNRIPLLVLVGLATAFMGYKSRDVELSYEYAQMLPDDDSAVIKYNRFKELFGEDGNVLVIGFRDSSIYDLETFNAWYQLGNKINDLNGVHDVASIARIVNIVKNDTAKKFEIEKVVKSPPQTQAELDSVMKIINSLPFYEGILLNSANNTTLMALTLDKDIINSKERLGLIQNINDVAHEFELQQNVKLHYSGLPYIRTRISGKVKQELNIFLILAALVTALILFMFFRSIKIVFFCMLVVGTAVVWTVGTLALFGYQITILTGLIPPIIIVIGIPNCIFLLNKYHREYRNHGNQIKALSRVIEKVGNATLLTNVTTASGFATFIVTQSAILKEFGVVASLNILGVFILSLLLIPTIFSFLAPPAERRTKHLENKSLMFAVDKLIHIVKYHRKLVYVITCITLVLAGVGISRMETTGNMVDDIPHNDPIYVDLLFFEKNFSGVMPFEISINTGKKRGVMRLSTLQKIDELQEMLSEYDVFSRPVSVADVVKFSKQAFYNGNEEKYSLPDNREKSFILSYASSAVKEQNNLSSFVDSNRQVTRVSAHIADVGTKEMERLTEELRPRIDSIFSPEKYEVTITGTSVIFHKGTEYLVKNLFVSLALAITLIAIFMALLFSSFRMILVSLVPNLIPLLFTAALMGYFNITIKPSTILIFSIAFGISVDDTIHYLAKYRQELRIYNNNIGKAVYMALHETGVSMIYTSIVLFFGFGIFTASDFGGTVALGVLVSVTLLVAMLSNLILLPSLLLSLEKALITKSFKKEPFIEIVDEEEDIELEKLEIRKETEENKVV